MNKLINDNTNEIIKILLTGYRSVNISSFIQQLNANPYFPSSLSICQSLKFSGIENVAANVSFDKLKETVDSSDFEVLAHMRYNQGSFINIAKIDSKYLYYYKNIHKELVRADVEEFKVNWTGNCIFVSSAADLSMLKNKRRKGSQMLSDKAFKFLLGLVLIFTVIYGFAASLSLFLKITYFLSLIGLVISTLLTLQSIGKTSNVLDNFCNSLNNNYSCKSVLQSSYSKITNYLSWSEIGLLFYICILFLVTVSSYFYLAPICIFFLSILAAPYTLFSIYTQKFILKTWCKLCLIIQGLILAQCVASFAFIKSHSFSFQNVNLLITLEAILSLFTALTVTFLLIKLYTRLIKIETAHNKVKNLKFKNQIFKTLTTSERLENIPYDDLYKINKLDYDKENSLVLILNLTCNTCAKAYEELINVLGFFDTTEVYLCIQTSDYNKKTTLIADILANLYIENRESFNQALESYYTFGYMNNTKWLLQFGKMKISSDVKSIRDKQDAWMDSLNIIHTPKIILNDRFLPKMYNMKDLKYLLS